MRQKKLTYYIQCADCDKYYHISHPHCPHCVDLETQYLDRAAQLEAEAAKYRKMAAQVRELRKASEL